MNVNDTANVSRVEVIDDSGRAYTVWKDGIRVWCSLQDDGRTLKVFIEGAKQFSADSTRALAMDPSVLQQVFANLQASTFAGDDEPWKRQARGALQDIRNNMPGGVCWPEGATWPRESHRACTSKENGNG